MSTISANEKCKLVMQELSTFSSSMHGGYYADKLFPDVIHVNVPLKSRLMLQTADNNVIYHSVNYARNQLFDYKQAISENVLGQYGVNMVAHKVIDNILEIGVDDDNPEVMTELCNKLESMEIPVDSYRIIKHKRFSTLEKKLEKPIIVNEEKIATAASYDHQHTVMAGGWIGMAEKNGDHESIQSFSSVTCGFRYNDWLGFLTCGHGRATGRKMYWASPATSGGSYPNDLWSYNPNWLVPLGTVQMRNYSNADYDFKCDFSTTKRAYNTTIMAGHAYSGDTLHSFGVEPYVEANGYFTGCANKKVACTVISDSADVTDMRGKRMNDLFLVNKPGILGTSGGPFYYKHMFNPDKFVVAGMACTTDEESTTGFAKIDNILAHYSFTPVF